MSSYLVPPNRDAQVMAARRLIRPHEVAPFLRTLRDEDPVVAVMKLLSILEYTPDPVGFDVWRSPAVTLERGGGDCEDLAIAGTSALVDLHVPVLFAVGTHNGVGHAWVEGWDPDWFLLEATEAVAWRGGRPSSYQVKFFVKPLQQFRRVHPVRIAAPPPGAVAVFF